MLLFFFVFMISLVQGVPPNTQSQSQSLSHSHSYSSGTCNPTSLEYYPLPQPDNTVNATFPLWPTKLNISLAGNRLNNNPSGGVGVYIYFNYTYFHERNPGIVQDCNLAPDFSNVPYVRFIESWRDFTPSGPFPQEFCNRICVVWFFMKLTCPVTAPSGTYSLKIQGVGDVEIDLSVCTNEGSDYDFDCGAIPQECRETSDFMTTETSKSGLTKADKVGIAFGVIGFAMLITIFALVDFYVNAKYTITKLLQKV